MEKDREGRREEGSEKESENERRRERERERERERKINREREGERGLSALLRRCRLLSRRSKPRLRDRRNVFTQSPQL